MATIKLFGLNYGYCVDEHISINASIVFRFDSVDEHRINKDLNTIKDWKFGVMTGLRLFPMDATNTITIRKKKVKAPSVVILKTSYGLHISFPDSYENYRKWDTDYFRSNVKLSKSEILLMFEEAKDQALEYYKKDLMTIARQFEDAAIKLKELSK